MKKSTKNTILSLTLVSLFTVSNVNAHDKEFSSAVENKEECPVNAAYPDKYSKDGSALLGSYDTSVVIDAEFGEGAQEITQCLKKRENAKIVVRVGDAFSHDAFGNLRFNKPLFLGNVDKMINQYENTHGMKIGKDVDIRVVFSGSGAALASTKHGIFMKAAATWNQNPANAGNLMTVSPVNPYISVLKEAMDAGIKFYLCQEASRTLGITMDNKIEGVNFVPAAHAATADFQMDGYAIILP